MPESFDLQILLCLKPGQKMSKCSFENSEGEHCTQAVQDIQDTEAFLPI